MKLRKRVRRRLVLLASALLLSAGGCLLAKTLPSATGGQASSEAAASRLDPSVYPPELIALYESNPDAEAFVLHYPSGRNKTYDIDLSACLGKQKPVPLYQWDERWGYTSYGGNLLGLSGCGPTCLSMVCLHLLQDPSLDPKTVAAFSEEKGYCLPGNGSAWTLISEGGEALGLEVTEIPLVKSRVLDNLRAGNPILCVMGPGDFTTSGHFIVLTGLQDGRITLNDPNSVRRTETLWDYDAIADQIRNLWVCRKP